MISRIKTATSPAVPAPRTIMMPPRRRIVPCWRRDASGRLIPFWKLVAAPAGRPPG